MLLVGILQHQGLFVQGSSTGRRVGPGIDIGVVHSRAIPAHLKVVTRRPLLTYSPVCSTRAASARGSPAKGIMSLATPQQPGKAESPSGLVASRRQTSSADSTGPASSRRASLTVDEQSLSSAAGESSTRSHPNSATSRRLSGSGSGKDPASIQQRVLARPRTCDPPHASCFLPGF